MSSFQRVICTELGPEDVSLSSFQRVVYMGRLQMELEPVDVFLLERCPHFSIYVQASMELGPPYLKGVLF